MTPALVSIHDVMPSTMDDVQELIDLCETHQLRPITLLIVPGCDWSDGAIDRIRIWQSRGHELAGHGWKHRCDQIRGVEHRLHSLFLSRNVAEHLCLRQSGIVELIKRCGNWFVDQGFDVPFLYVPPAWAMGRVDKPLLKESPFQMYETLSGVFTVAPAMRRSLPLVGFEADTRLRKSSLRVFNRVGQARAEMNRHPLRVSIHPQDHRLLLQSDLRRVLAESLQAISYRELVAGA